MLRSTAVLTHPWFWVLLVGSLFSIPLIKGLGADALVPPPGWDGEPLAFELPDESGRLVSRGDLAGQLLVVTELPLANGVETERTFDGIRVLRKRLRGLGGEVVFAVLCHGADAQALSELLDRKTARKPVNLFLLDEEHRTIDALRLQAGGLSADFLLLDRHGRARGLYRSTEEDQDRLVSDAGLLANWTGADPEPGQPVASR